MKIQTYAGVSTVVTQRTVETVEVIDGLFAYRETQQVSTQHRMDAVEPAEPTTTETVSEGVLDRANLDKKLAQQPYTRCSYQMWDDANLEELRRWGYFGLCDRYAAQQVIANVNHRIDFEKMIAGRSIFEAFSTGKGQTRHLCVFNHSNLTLYNLDGQPLPTGQNFNDLNGHFDNAHYDLMKAAKHLMGRPDVLVIRSVVPNTPRRSPVAARYESKGVLPEAAELPQHAIHSIPYYNAGVVRSHELKVYWQPSDEDWAKVLAAVPERKKPENGMRDFDRHWIAEVVFNLDLLGLRAAGAALFDVFDQSRPEPDDED